MFRKHEIKTEVVAVDAEFAELYLSNNPINRHVSRVKVDNYANQMMSNQWAINGEAVIISDQERLLDGQHRLLAIKENNLKIPLLCVFGVKEDTFDTIDTGKSRTAADVLTIDGMSTRGATALSSAIKMDINMSYGGTTEANPKSTVVTSNKMVLDIANNESGYKSALDALSPYYKRGTTPFSLSTLVFLLHRFNLVGGDVEFNEKWLIGLMTGEGLMANDARLWIRDRIIREFTRSTKSRGRVRAQWVIRAWNKASQGKKFNSENVLFYHQSNALKLINLETDKRQL